MSERVQPYGVHFLDTNTIIKKVLYPDVPEDREPGINALNEFINRNLVYYVLDFCIFEAYSILKKKYLNKKEFNNYELAVYRLNSVRKHNTLITKSSDQVFFDEALGIVRKFKFKIDIFDAMQIHFIKNYPVESLFITADAALCSAARSEGLNVWDCIKMQPPDL